MYTGIMTSRESLQLEGLRVLDGGLATELEKDGCDLSGPLWSGDVLRTAPERVRAVHRAYLEAGADCLLTASYQLSRMGFRELGLTDADADQALRIAVDIALETRAEYRWQNPRPVWIAASLGPYGAALHNGAEFHGNYSLSFEQLVAFHRERIVALRGTEADFFAFETVPSLEEARAVAQAIEIAPETAVCVSFTCRDGTHVAHGEELADCARLMDGAEQVVAVGVNCTSPSLMLPLIAQMRSVTRKKIAVYPNSGEQWNQEARGWSGSSDPTDFGRAALAWRAAGADWIGGCCRTGPAHVRAISMVSDVLRAKN